MLHVRVIFYFYFHTIIFMIQINRFTIQQIIYKSQERVFYLVIYQG